MGDETKGRSVTYNADGESNPEGNVVEEKRDLSKEDWDHLEPPTGAAEPQRVRVYGEVPDDTPEAQEPEAQPEPEQEDKPARASGPKETAEVAPEETAAVTDKPAAKKRRTATKH